MIYNQDCTTVDWSGADVLICDPPYASHINERATSQSAKGGATHREMGFNHLSSDLMMWTALLASEIPRWSVIFSDLESITHWKSALEHCGATYIRTIPWVRWSMPQLSGDRPPQGAEAIIIAYGNSKGKKHWNGPGNLTHFENTCLRGKGKHKAEKPLDLMLSLVDWFSDAGETVVDPFSGSGTTGLACALLGRTFKGAELDPDWAVKANSRIASVSDMSKRDRDRYDTWLESNVQLKKEMARMKAINEKARYKNG